MILRALALLLPATLLTLAIPARSVEAFCLNKLPGYKEFSKWQKAVPYYVSDNVKDAKVLAAIDAAFQTWASVKCAGLKFSKGGTFKLGAQKFENHGKFGIHIYWYDAATGFPSQPAFVSYTFYGVDAKGALNQGSIAINSFKYVWATDGSASALDVQGEITALIGRAIGLADSDAKSSVMTNNLKFGDTSKRTLKQDDIDAITYLYTGTGCTKPAAPGANNCNGGSTVNPPSGDSGAGASDGGGAGAADAGAGGGDAGAGGSGTDTGAGNNGGGGGGGGGNNNNNNGGGGGNSGGGCSTSAQCASGEVCTAEGACVSVGGSAGGSPEGGGCAAASGAGDDAIPAMPTLLLLALGGALLIRRERRRS